MACIVFSWKSLFWVTTLSNESSPLGLWWKHMSLVVRKPVFGVSDQVRHKPGCAATGDGLSFEISDLWSRGIVLSMLRKQWRWSAAQILCSWSASLFLHMQKAGFLTTRLKCYVYIDAQKTFLGLLSEQFWIRSKHEACWSEPACNFQTYTFWICSRFQGKPFPYKSSKSFLQGQALLK